MFRSANTILFLTPDRIVRADLDGEQVSAFWSDSRPPVEDLAMLVESALRLGGKRRRRVWILATELWSQVVPILADATRGISRNELQRVLAFEAEPLSGLSAFEATLGHTLVASDGYHRHYWLTQLSTWELSQIEETLQQHGCTLGGVMHPGGLPRPVPPHTASQSWQRIELWPENVILLHGHGRQVETQIIAGGSGREVWKQDAEEWFRTHGLAEQRSLLVFRGEDVGGGFGDETEQIDLGTDAALKSWLEGWGSLLTRDETAVPLVRPAPEPMPARSQVLIAGALASGVIAGCFLLHRSVEGRLAETRAETQQLEERTSRFESFDGEIKTLTEQLDGVTERREQLERNLATYEGAITAQRQRIAALLAVLASERPEHLMIERIEHSGDRLTISGTSLGPEAATSLAVSLNRQVGRLGWQIGLPRQQAGSLENAGAPWRFRLDLVDVEVPPTEPAPAVAGQPRQRKESER